MKRVLSVATFLIVAGAAIAGPVPKAIRAQYAGMVKAMRAKDSAAFKSFFAEEFVSIGPDKKSLKREEFYKLLDKMFDKASKVEANLKLISSKKRGEEVDVKVELRGTIYRTPIGTTKYHEICVDTWRKVNGKWLTVKTVDSVFDVVESSQKKGK